MIRSTRSFAKKASNLYQSMPQQLNRYALAAVAAVVSVLAFTQPSEAKIVYTKVNIRIGTNQCYNLDLNHDGVTDFVIQNNFYGREDCSKWIIYVAELPTLGNGAVDSPPAALNRGAQIGHGQPFYEGTGTMASAYPRRECHFFGEGPRANVTDRFLGLRVQLNGRIHYGWARLSVRLNGPAITATLKGYAFETIAAKSIKAGQTKEAADESSEEDFGRGALLTSPIPDTLQPPSFSMIALGLQGALLGRRRESTVEGDLKGAL